MTTVQEVTEDVAGSYSYKTRHVNTTLMFLNEKGNWKLDELHPTLIYSISNIFATAEGWKHMFCPLPCR